MMSSCRSLVRLSRIKTLRLLAKCFGSGWSALPAKQLIIAPHPDDETFGLGGLIALNSTYGARENRKAETHIVFLTSGGAAHRRCCGITSDALARLREKTAGRAIRNLGVPEENLYFLRLEDGSLPHPGEYGFDHAVNLLRSIVEEVRPDVVFAPHPFEGWSDHVAAEHLVQRAIRRLSETPVDVSLMRRQRPKLCHYCVWFWFSMPVRKALRVQWQRAKSIDLQSSVSSSELTKAHYTAQQAKLAAMKVYFQDLCPCGKPACGVLPLELVWALEWDHELFFEVA